MPANRHYESYDMGGDEFDREPVELVPPATSAGQGEPHQFDPEPAPNEREIVERLETAQCLKNAHQRTATAYAQLQSPQLTKGHMRRVVSETLDAVDWLRRALEHFDRLLEANDDIS